MAIPKCLYKRSDLASSLWRNFQDRIATQVNFSEHLKKEIVQIFLQNLLGKREHTSQLSCKARLLQKWEFDKNITTKENCKLIYQENIQNSKILSNYNVIYPECYESNL